MNAPLMPDIGLLVLRLTLGGLTFAHGLHKVGNLRGFATNWGLSLPVATAAMLVQAVGGALIFLGIATQLAALANVVVNIGILYSLVVKAREPFLAPAQHSWSIGLAYLGMSLSVALLGGGRFALNPSF